MVDKQTSDERLLKLIEGGAESRHPGSFSASGKKTLGGLLPLKFNLAEIKSKLKDLKLNILLLNRGLIALAVLLTVIFLYTLINGALLSKASDIRSVPADSSAIIKLISAGQAQGLVRKNISAQDIRRNFFLPPGSKSIVSSEPEALDLAEEVKALKLVGIIWSKNPEVMVENTKDSRTYTLKKGESFSEQFKIKEISRNSATLEVTTESGTKEYELR